MEMVSVPPVSHPMEPLPVVETEPDELTAVVPEVRGRVFPRAVRMPPPVFAAAPAAVELGQLTAGSDASNTGMRQQAEGLLRGQQQRLIGIPSSVVVLHAQQVEQARLFLRQADEAWKKLDVEGTRTLATKAKVLLDEILE